jgi:hypothetical protein
MNLGQVCERIAFMDPHFFSSFYRRVLVLRDSPQPASPFVTVDVTHRCSLKCPFCIAASVLDQREMPLETFARVCREVSGVSRLTLIGGEPFEHRSLADMISLARTCAPEIEVFTNGLFLGTREEEVTRQLRKRIPDPSSDWLTLVLSVDPGHASQMTWERLRNAVRLLLKAEHLGLCRARFSITHESLTTGQYQDQSTVRGALAAVTSDLLDVFDQRLETNRIHETFYFNSVICGQVAGGQSSDPGLTTQAPDGGSEFLRLEDLVLSPEVAVTFDPQGDALTVTSLSSMWTRRPPPATVLGFTHRAGLELALVAAGGHDEIASLISGEGTVPPSAAHPLWLEAWMSALNDGHETRLRLLRAYGPFHHTLCADGAVEAVNHQARRYLAFLSRGTGDRVLLMGGTDEFDRLAFPVLAKLIGYLAADPGFQPALLRAAVSSTVASFGLHQGGPARPTYVGWREILGKRVPLAEGESHPIDRVHLPGESGFGAKDELVLRPTVQFHPDGSIALELPGIVPSAEPANEASLRCSLERILGMWGALGGESFAKDVLDALPAPFGNLGAAVTPNPLRPPVPANDLVKTFEACSFQRNRNAADWDNPELLGLVLASADSRFSMTSRKEFRSRVMARIRRRTKEQSLSLAVRMLLDRI